MVEGAQAMSTMKQRMMLARSSRCYRASRALSNSGQGDLIWAAKQERGPAHLASEPPGRCLQHTLRPLQIWKGPPPCKPQHMGQFPGTQQLAVLNITEAEAAEGALKVRWPMGMAVS
jgi:hypothetical protein